MLPLQEITSSKLNFADVNMALDYALLRFQNRLSKNCDDAKIAIQCGYSQLPEIECYPAQVKLAFCNIVSYAIHVLEEKLDLASGITPQLSIKTKLDTNNRVVILIEDNLPTNRWVANACPLTPATTVTEPGLALSYRILVEKHGGTLIWDTSPDRGTEFFIALPRYQLAIL